MRKKRLAILLLSVIAAASCAIGLAACNLGGNEQGGNEPQEHVHTLTHHGAVAATCTQSGTIEYWVCSECGKYFGDGTGTTEITGITVAALGHDWGDWTVTTAATCTTVGEETRVCSHDNSHKETREIAIDANNHDGGEWTVTTAATCTAVGEETRVCSHDSNHTETREIAKLPHTLVHHNAVEATCTETGNVEYWVCSECGKYFSDENATTEITDITLDAPGHDWGEWTVTTAATCTAVGEETRVCSHDNNHTETREVAIDENNHDWGEWTVTTAATCTTVGEEMRVCSLDESHTETRETKKPHTLTKVEAVEATCTETGNIEYWVCSECGGYFSDQDGENQIEDKSSVITAELGHNYVDGICTRCGDVEVTPTEGLEYTTYSTYATVTGIGTATDTDIVIAEEYEGLPVTSIGSSAFKNCASLTSVTLQKGVTSIGKSAFSGCTSLSSVTIGKGVTSIGDSAFFDCTALTEINYNATECADLSSSNYVFYTAGQSGDGITVNIGANVKKIPAYLFYPYSNPYSNASYPPKIVNVVFAENSVCESIGNYAFYGCKSLTSVTIGNTVTSIGNYAFYYCSSLESITIGNSVTSIGNYAFYYCTSLTSVTIGNSVTSIGNYAFENCSSLESITVDENNSHFKSIDGNLYSYDGTTLIQYAIGKTDKSFEIPDGVNSIGQYAFAYCSSLTSITIPDTVTSIGSMAFDNCYKLVEVYNLSSLTITAGSSDNGYVGYYALGVYNSLETESKLSTDDNGYVFYADGDTVYLVGYTGSDTELTLPDSFNGKNYAINKYAFYGCKSLKSVTIGNSVTSIESSAFEDCTSLESITIPYSVTYIGTYAFYGCKSLSDIYYGGDVEGWLSISGLSNLMSYGSSSKNLYFNNKLVTEITIPDSVTSIGSYTFYGCTSLTSITIPDTVTSIGNYAFYYCTALTEINYNATECADLSSSNYVFYKAGQSGDGITVNIGANVKKIPAYLFYSNGSSPKIVSVVFAENSVCESIGNYAFYGCSSLTSIIIPDTVTSIGSRAFQCCYKLVEVYNLSSLEITAGSTNNGWVGYYALNVYTSLDTVSKLSTDDDGYIFYDDDDTVYLVGYTGSDTELTLPESFNGKNYVINKYAFYGCTSLTSVTIPDTVTSIGYEAFYDCTSLTNIYYTGDIASWCGISGLSNLMWHSNFMLYGSSSKNLYFNNELVTEITIPDTVTSIESRAFGDCTSLTSVTIGNSVTSIGSSAFYGCTSLTSVTIGNSVTSIGSSAFYGCTSLKSVTIGNGITSIGSDAFYNCKALTEINYNATECADLSSSNYVFSYAGQSGDGITVNIGANVKKIPAYLFYPYSSSSYLPKIVSVVFAENSVCESIGTYAFYGCSSLTSIIIPDSVTSIGSYAFYGCYKLVEVYNLSSLNITKSSSNGYVGCYALGVYTSLDTPSKLSTDDNGYIFYDNGYTVYLIGYTGSDTQLTLPDSFNGKNYVINQYAFYGCTSLKSVTISNGVTSIGNYAFYYCTSLTSITIPDGVTSIGSYAFYNCTSLTSITIPDTVTSIGNYAFEDCKSLNTVYYNGTAEDWDNISIDSYGDTYLTDATRYYYSESEPEEEGNYWHYVDGEIVIWTKE